MAHITFYVIAAALACPVSAFAASPYAGDESREIKALSDQEVADYLSGKGMGFAKAAELNGYPGPAHVLELAEQLALSPVQKTETEAIFRRMQGRASAAGKRLVAEERRLDELFASKAISPTLLHQTIETIASLQSQIREIHLQAHLEQTEVLSEIQATRYWHLRGYVGNQSGHHHPR
jgi:hypothetical protein